MTGTPDDPAYRADINEALFGDENTRRQREAEKAKPGGPKRQPHSLLKRACRKALHDYIKSNGGCAVTIPIQNMRVPIPGTDKSYTTGRVGAGDDMMLIRIAGVSLTCSIEYKAGRDRQSPKQVVFESKWVSAGGVYIVARDPASLVAAIKDAFRRKQSQL